MFKFPYVCGDQCSCEGQRDGNDNRADFLYSFVACSCFSWVCNACRNGGGIFPGEKGDEVKSACGDQK